MYSHRPLVTSASRIGCLLAITVTASFSLSFAADPKSAQLSPDALIERLQNSTGSTIAVEMKSGDTFNRATLVRIAFDAKKKSLLSITIQDAAADRSRTLGFAAVRSLILDREKVYEAPLDQAKTAADVRAQKQAAKESEERQQWVARAQKNGVKSWPELTKAQHEAAIEELKGFVVKVQQAVPDLQLYETQEFLFCSNLSEKHVPQFTQALDAMHDLMCTMYGIKSSEPVWKGKCLVVAFVEREQYLSFEQDFMKNSDASKYQGLCHPNSDGRVVISCYTGTDPQFFANLLVHETSHGFIHRYRTARRPPSWVNEGMADSIARRLVPTCQEVQANEARAIQTMRKTHSMGGDFLDRRSNIDGWQYGVASSLTDFLISANAKAYTRFIQGIKEGLKWEDSLQAAYDRTPEQLVAAYGESIGVPDLQP